MHAHRLARRLRAGLRGWGGVGAMAAVCALALAFALLLPLTQSSGAAGATGSGGSGRRPGQPDQGRRLQDAERPAGPEPVPVGRRRRHTDPRQDQGPQGPATDRRRRPEQLPLGLPQPEQHLRRAGGLRHRPRPPDRQGHPRRRGRGLVQGDPHQPAHPGDPERRGRHGGPHHDDQLRPAEPGRVLRALLQDRPAGPRPQDLDDHRVQRHARPQAGLLGRRVRRRWTVCSRTRRPAGSRPAPTSRRWSPTSWTAW